MQKQADGDRLNHFLKTSIIVKQWLEEVLVIKLPADLLDSLRNGVVLCYLMNEIQNKVVIPKIQEKTTQVFKLKENISAFILACEDYGVHKARLFRPLDLYERKGEVLVIECLMELATLAAQRGYRPGPLPPEQYTGPMPELTPAQKTLLSKQLAALKDKRKAVKIQRISPEIFKRRIQYLTGSGTIDWEVLEKRLTLLQALGRTYVQQKRYRRRVRDLGYREHVAKEIFITEKAYVNSLLTCTKHYRTPLEEEAALTSSSSTTLNSSASVGPPNNNTPLISTTLYHSNSNTQSHSTPSSPHNQPPRTPLISKDDITIVFSNMNVLIGLNSELLNNLENRIENWNHRQLIGDLFVQMLPHLKIYTQYLSNYHTASARLTQLKQNPQFLSLMNTLKANPELKKMELTSYLIMPVQRVPRYNLLLRDLAKHTWPEHPDYENLNHAAAEVETLAKFLEEKTKFSDDLLKLTEISTQVKDIPFTLAKPSRRFIRETYLPDQKQTVFLFNNLLLIARPKKTKKAKKKMLVLTTREEKLVYYAHLSLSLSDTVDTGETKLLLRLMQAQKTNGGSVTSSPQLLAEKNGAYYSSTIELQFLDNTQKKEWLAEYTTAKEQFLEKVSQRKKSALQLELQKTSKTTEEVLRIRRQRGNSDARTYGDDEEEEELSPFYSSPHLGEERSNSWVRKSLRLFSGLVSSEEDETPVSETGSIDEKAKPLTPNRSKRRSWSRSLNRTLLTKLNEDKDKDEPEVVIPTEQLSAGRSREKRGSIIRLFMKN